MADDQFIDAAATEPGAGPSAAHSSLQGIVPMADDDSDKPPF